MTRRLVHGDEHFAALMAALLGARLLVFDVIAGNTDFDEAADQVADMRVATVAGISEPEMIKAGNQRLGFSWHYYSSVMRARVKCWFLSAVRSARTSAGGLVG